MNQYFEGMFPKHKYIGPERNHHGYIPGKEYDRVSIERWGGDNTMGVFMSTTEYSGIDTDYCCFFPVDSFAHQFSPDIPKSLKDKRVKKIHQSVLREKRKERRRCTYE